MLNTRTVDINLFGRPHLTSDGEPLKFKAPARALSLLAYLLVDTGAPLARDAVAFALWPDDTEADARANLRRHMFYIGNDVLPQAPPEMPWIRADKRTIAWNAAAPATCDVREFQRLAADPATAPDAVRLYRGDLLEGFEDEWLAAPRERLRELQVRLLLDLMAACRARGDHAAAIAYARQLLAVDPWREDGIRALVAARHAAGDRAGALATYRDFVKRLDAEMGVAPMPETTAEYQRVAAALDPLPAPPAAANPATHGAAQPAPREQPYWRAPESISNAEATRPVPSFTGRGAELAAVEAALWDGRGAAAVYGLGGVGKSALAREYARSARERYAAVWWLNAETEAGIIDGLITLGAEFVLGLERLDDRRAAAERVTTNVLAGLTKPVLLIFDNLDDEALLRAWVPHSHAHILITSRHADWGGDVVRVPLGAWQPEDTIAYLRREIGRADFGDGDALLLAETLGRLPLALAHAAAYLKSTINVTAARYLERIGDHLERNPKGAEYARAVYATFQAAIRRAEEEAPGAAALLCLAACYAPDAVPEELFRQDASVYEALVPPSAEDRRPARALRDTVRDAAGGEEALGALHRFSLLTFELETRTYTMHRLVQQAALAGLGAGAAEWLRNAVGAAEAAFPLDDFAHWPRCEALLPHARAALWALPADACFPSAARLALSCGRYARKRAAFAEAEQFLRRGLAMAEICAEPAGVAEHLEALGALLRDTNRPAEAEPLQRRALAICEAEFGEQNPRVAAAQSELAILLQYSNRLSEAEALFRRALAVDEAAFGDAHPTVAVRLHNLAISLHETNRTAEAEALLRRALVIDEAATGGPGEGEHPDVASDGLSLGWLLFETGRAEEAEPLLRRAVAIREAAYGDAHPAFALALSDLGVLFADTGRIDQAARLSRRALDVCEAAYGHKHPVVAACANNVAESLADDGSIDAAVSLYRRALDIDETTYGATHANVARDLNNLAGALLAHGGVRDAEAALQRALAILEASYAPDHPRVQTVRANSAALRARTTSARPARSAARWRNIRRSASRGLR